MMGAGMVARSGWGMASAFLIVSAVGQGRVDFAQHFGRAFAVAANHDAVREQEIGDGGAFAQKLRIRSHIERFGIGAAAQDDLAYPLAGVDRDRTLLNDDFVAVNAAGNLAGHRLHVRKISFAALGGRRSDGDKDRRTHAHCVLQVVGKRQAMSAMAVQQLRQKLFVDGDLAILQRGQFPLVVVDQNDVMPKVRKTSACHQPYVSGAYDRDPHLFSTPVMECPETDFVWVASAGKPRGELRKTAWKNSSNVAPRLK